MFYQYTSRSASVAGVVFSPGQGIQSIKWIIQAPSVENCHYWGNIQLQSHWSGFPLQELD
jgi:hypothetical protein